MMPRTLILAAAIACVLALGPLRAAAQDDIPAARVVMPWSDFKTLYDRGMAPETPPENAPRDYAISRALYDGEVQGESTRFHARVRIDVLKQEGWSSVPVLPTSVALRQARVGGADAPIYLDGGWYRYITDRSGPVTLELEFAVTTWESSGQTGFAFELAPSGGTEVTLAVPADEELSFEIANAQQVTEEIRAGQRIVQALLPASGNLSVTWEVAAPEVAPELLEPRVYAEHQELVGVGEGLLQCRSTIRYSILHAGVDAFRVTLPADVTVLEVEGRGLRDWSAATTDGRTAIDVTLTFAAQGPYDLVLEYERPLPDGGGTVVVPDLQIDGVERVKGWVGVDARSNLEIVAGKPDNASVVDVRELPAAILGQTDWPVLYGFKVRQGAYRIPLELRQHADVDMLVTIIDRIEATTVMTPDGRRMTQVAYEMRNNRAQFLRLSLPGGAVPWSTFVAGRAVKPARADDGRVLIPLARSQTSGGELAHFRVELVYVEDGAAPDDHGKGAFAAELPIADVPATVCTWTVLVPWDAKIKKSSYDGTLRKVDYFTTVYVPVTPDSGVQAQVRAANAGLFDSEALSGGVQPVKVTLPTDGMPLYFEKLLVLDEPLTVAFAYGGLK